MAEPRSEDDGILREWAPLSGFLKEVPLTVRRGLFLETVSLTCIDAASEYLAVGTNIGVVYWYDRETHNMQRLRPEKSTFKITCVKLVSSVDFMVAAGDESGTVTVFRIPKPTPDWISPAYKPNSTSNVERYTVGGLHSAPVTALEWSTNGQKLFSGDSTGLVVLTEIDFYMNLSKACEILNEKYRIVQLSFHQNSQALVLATEYRCIVAHRQEGNNWRVVQIGQQERRSLCRVGATFFPHPERLTERVIYSGRAGVRFWQADTEGFVHKTLIFKDALKKPHQHILLLHPNLRRDGCWDKDLSCVLAWRGLYLVSYNASGLVVLDPKSISVIASLSGLTDLHSVAVTNTEIFLIAGTRNIMRLSYVPDSNAAKHEEVGLSLLESKVSPVTGTLIDLTAKLKNTATQFVNSRPGIAISGSLEEDVTTGTDALELDLPPVRPLDSGVQELSVQLHPRSEILHHIGKQSFDDVLFSSTRKVKGKTQKLNKNNISSNGIGIESCSDTVSVASLKSEESSSSESDSRPPSQNNNHSSESQPQPRLALDLVPSSSHLSGAIPPDILPDLRSPDSILKDVHDKEILVAKAFNLEEVLLPEKKNVNKQENYKTIVNYTNEQREESLGYGPPSGSSSAIPSLEAAIPSAVPDMDLLSQANMLADEKLANHLAMELNCTSTTTGFETGDDDGWTEMKTPESAQYLSVSENYVCVSGPSRSLHTAALDTSALSWQRLPYRAMDLALSPDSQVVWKLDFGVASALTDLDLKGPWGSKWETAARGVDSVALADSSAWYVSHGQVYLQTELSRGKPFRDACPLPCPALVLKICCSHHMVWVLTHDHWVLWRAGVTEQCLEGSHWQRVNTPPQLQVADIALGPYNVGWIVDHSNEIYFSDNYISEDCSWWQVLIRNYLFENSLPCQIACNDTSVWVTNKISQAVYKNSSSIKGHRWIEVTIKNLAVPLRWRQISAEGVIEDKGSIWLLSSANDLFHLRPNADNVNVIALPCRAEDVCSLTAAPHTLWLLTHSGQIHVRQGMGDVCPEGDRWRTLNLEQISNKQVTLCHVSCGCDIIWACDTKGDVYMAVASPYLISTDTFSPAWVQVEGKPLSNTRFIKVFVGSETHIVWALDNRNNVYVRSGIFHDFQLGTDWVLVPGLQATEITISGSLVWVLSTTKSVFCRFGISENNYIGNYWHQVPGTLHHLTASYSEGLWGVSEQNGSLVLYTRHELPVSDTARQSIAVVTDRDDDWEVI